MQEYGVQKLADVEFHVDPEGDALAHELYHSVSDRFLPLFLFLSLFSPPLFPLLFSSSVSLFVALQLFSFSLFSIYRFGIPMKNKNIDIKNL